MKYYFTLILLIFLPSCNLEDGSKISHAQVFRLLKSMENTLSTWPVRNCNNVSPMLSIYPESFSLRIRGLHSGVVLNEYRMLEKIYPVKQLAIESGRIQSPFLDSLSSIFKVETLNIHNSKLELQKDILDLRRFVYLKEILITGKESTERLIIYLPKGINKITLLSQEIEEATLVYSKVRGKDNKLDFFLIHSELTLLQKKGFNSFEVYHLPNAASNNQIVTWL